MNNWIVSSEAQALMEQMNGRPVHVTYLNTLAREGKIKSKPLGGNANLYYKPDVAAYRIRPKRQKQTV